MKITIVYFISKGIKNKCHIMIDKSTNIGDVDAWIRSKYIIEYWKASGYKDMDYHHEYVDIPDSEKQVQLNYTH